ncbi:uncharacterized protein BX663DRAFT_509870 [Cokeromyces recurvatus]|uniref:uncharacterized protein n=1 Tax=Cokeromyces recurvatus TaxID=90255 RepID=UPI00221E6585|nr:uncharacterized protein BX663DRAFT_509870 [Cokeromyces recurvatus]KAI7902615.1 hypothetical protein BX663DRAFT_509870 [Cokeromyces recurvatus]
MTSLSELKQRLFHPHYVLHFIYGIIYIIVRLNYLLKNQLINFEETESKSYILLLGVCTWKCFMAATAEELSGVIILYTKFFTLCSLFWKMGFWTTFFYIIGWIILSTIFPQPWYRGPTKIYELNEAAFRDKVLKSNTTKSPKPSSKSTVPVEDIKGPRITEITEEEDKKEEEKTEDEVKYWIVMLYANWSVSCLNFEAVLAKLSIQYDVPHLKFGQIDVDIYPDLAEEFGVSKDPASFDLPTLILFQNGKELRRLPELTITKDGKNSKANAAKDTITRLGWSKHPSAVIKTFQLKKIANEKQAN